MNSNSGTTNYISIFAVTTLILAAFLAPSKAAAYSSSVTLNAPTDGIQTIFGTPLSASSSALVSIDAWGDFGGNNDWVQISIEGFNLGILYNGNPADDLYDNAGFGDLGVDVNPSPSTTAAIDLLSLNSILSDGQIDIDFLFSGAPSPVSYVNDLTVDIRFDTSPVPLPPAALLLASGLLGMVGFRKTIK